MRLELLDDLHRADLRRPGHGTRREGRGEHACPVHVVAEARGNLGDAVMDSPMRLEHARRRHAHRAEIRDATEVVAHQVDDHGELGRVLGALGQFARVHRRRSCALDRPRDHRAVGTNAKEELRAHRDEALRTRGTRGRSVVAVAADRRNVDRCPEPRAVLGDGCVRERADISRDSRRKSPRDVRLEGVAFADVLDYPRDARCIVRVTRVRLQPGQLPGTEHACPIRDPIRASTEHACPIRAGHACPIQSRNTARRARTAAVLSLPVQFEAQSELRFQWRGVAHRVERPVRVIQAPCVLAPEEDGMRRRTRTACSGRPRLEAGAEAVAEYDDPAAVERRGPRVRRACLSRRSRRSSRRSSRGHRSDACLSRHARHAA